MPDSSNPLHPALAPGRLAIVTGAAGGIGFAAAKRFLELGLRVCIADCDTAALEAAAGDLGAFGEVLAEAVDVADAAAMTWWAEKITARFGAIAVLMNNAGIGGGGDALANPEGWRKVLGVNLMGVLNGVQAFVPAMVAGGQPGLVINTGSKQGITQPPGDTAYNVSKAAVKALTEGLAHSLRTVAGDRITAHLLVPGFTYTRMMTRHFAEKPPAAWTADQVAERLLQGIADGQFYIICPDNETTPEQDAKRILWAARDLVEGRPALSRWHDDYKDAFAEYMSGSGS